VDSRLGERRGEEIERTNAKGEADLRRVFLLPSFVSFRFGLVRSSTAFNLDYYTEVQDLSQISVLLDKDPRMARFGDLNKAICEIVEDYGLVGFETLAVEVSSLSLLFQRFIPLPLAIPSFFPLSPSLRCSSPMVFPRSCVREELLK